MSTSYAQLVDPQLIERIIGSDYQNGARLITSGVVRREGVPMESTQVEWVKNTLFSTEDEGQAIGVNTEINLKSLVQTEYAMSIVSRADGAELDDIVEEITPKRQTEIEATFANDLSRKAGQMVDSVGIKIIDGCRAFIVTDTTNYNDANGSQVNLVDLEQTKATRGENGQNFAGGFMIMRGIMYHQMAALGLVAATSNTMGNMAQNEIVRGGLKGTILDMNILTTDKIALETTGGVDHFIIMIEAGALAMKLSGAPKIDPFIRATKAFKDSVKFRLRLGGIVDGLSWSAAKTNIVTNTDLATGTNYEQAATYMKNVPMCVVRFDAPSFA